MHTEISSSIVRRYLSCNLLNSGVTLATSYSLMPVSCDPITFDHYGQNTDIRKKRKNKSRVFKRERVVSWEPCVFIFPWNTK